MKRCTECDIEKPEDSYGTERFRRDGSRLLKAKCKYCIARRAAARKSPRKLLDHRPRLREDGEWVKPCSSCHRLKPLREFNREKGRFAYPCRRCVKIDRAIRYDANPEPERRRRGKFWESLTPKERRQRRMANYCRNRAWFQNRWKKATPEERRMIYDRANQIRREWPGAKKRAKYMAYRLSHITTQMNKRARASGAWVEDLDFFEVFLEFKGICYLCGGDVDIDEASPDHIIPYAKGGQHRRSNVGLAHKRCNFRKHDKLVSELAWIHPSHFAVAIALAISL